MSSGPSLRSTGRAAALLAGASLAARAPGAAASDRALLGVSLIVEPSCAISAPSTLRPGDLRAQGSIDDVRMLDIACTSGTSWSATAEPQPVSTTASVSIGESPAPKRRSAVAARPAPAEADAASARTIRITVRY